VDEREGGRWVIGPSPSPRGSRTRRRSSIEHDRWSPRGDRAGITTWRTRTMRGKIAVLGVAMLTVLAVNARAGSTLVGRTVGLGVATGSYGDAAASGWHIGATGTHMVNPQWGFGGDVAYHAWGGSDQANAAAEVTFGPGSEFKWNAIQATAHAVMAFPTQSNV